jgi:hypothetical protein
MGLLQLQNPGIDRKDCIDMSSSAWKKQADLRHRLSVHEGNLDNENIIISQSLYDIYSVIIP